MKWRRWAEHPGSIIFDIEIKFNLCNLMDDIVYYAGSEAHQYLQSQSLLDEGEEGEVVWKEQFNYLDSDSDSEILIQSPSNTKQAGTKKYAIAVTTGLQKSTFIALASVAFASFCFDETFMGALLAVTFIWYLATHTHIVYQTSTKVPLLLAELLQFCQDTTPNPALSNIIWSSVHRIMKPVISAGLEASSCLPSRDMKFLQQQLQIQDQFHTYISITRKLRRLSRLMGQLESSFFWSLPNKKSILYHWFKIGRQIFLYSIWYFHSQTAANSLSCYLAALKMPLNPCTNRQEQSLIREKSKKSQYYDELFTNIQQSLSSQHPQSALPLLGLLRLQLTNKASAFSQIADSNAQEDELDEQSRIGQAVSDRRMRQLEDYQYSTEEEEPNKLSSMFIEGQIMSLRPQLDLIIGSKFQQKERGSEHKQEPQEDKKQGGRLVEREVRVEGFGMLLGLKRHVDLQYVE